MSGAASEYGRWRTTITGPDGCALKTRTSTGWRLQVHFEAVRWSIAEYGADEELGLPIMGVRTERVGPVPRAVLSADRAEHVRP